MYARTGIDKRAGEGARPYDSCGHMGRILPGVIYFTM
jgi:hypothetical protein